MATKKTCDVCGLARISVVDGQPVSNVRRFTLRREADQKRERGVRTNRLQQGGGGIDLCQECWERICKPNMNPKKANNRREPDVKTDRAGGLPRP
jgi:hypothetical protein